MPKKKKMCFIWYSNLVFSFSGFSPPHICLERSCTVKTISHLLSSVYVWASVLLAGHTRHSSALLPVCFDSLSRSLFLPVPPQHWLSHSRDDCFISEVTVLPSGLISSIPRLWVCCVVSIVSNRADDKHTEQNTFTGLSSVERSPSPQNTQFLHTETSWKPRALCLGLLCPYQTVMTPRNSSTWHSL